MQPRNIYLFKRVYTVKKFSRLLIAKRLIDNWKLRINN